MNETIEQMRQSLSGKIKSMRKVFYGDITDEKAREADVAFNMAETWFALAFNKKRWMQIFYAKGQFETAEKCFWKIIKGGKE